MPQWQFKDLDTLATYDMEVNPNEGGSPSIQKNIAQTQNVGPNRSGIIQEGSSTSPTLSFSGVILAQGHYEAMEQWMDKRVLLELVDDLGRTFKGVLSSFDPQREYRPYRPWYHKYSAEFTVWAYKNASGVSVYGRYE